MYNINQPDNGKYYFIANLLVYTKGYEIIVKWKVTLMVSAMKSRFLISSVQELSWITEIILN